MKKYIISTVIGAAFLASCAGNTDALKLADEAKISAAVLLAKDNLTMAISDSCNNFVDTTATSMFNAWKESMNAKPGIKKVVKTVKTVTVKTTPPNPKDSKISGTSTPVTADDTKAKDAKISGQSTPVTTQDTKKKDAKMKGTNP